MIDREKTGRRAGVPNKRKTFRAAIILARKKISPVEEILKCIPALPIEEQVKAWKYLHEYVDVRPTALEDADARAAALDEQFEDVPTTDLVALVKRG